MLYDYFTLFTDYDVLDDKYFGSDGFTLCTDYDAFVECNELACNVI